MLCRQQGRQRFWGAVAHVAVEPPIAGVGQTWMANLQPYPAEKPTGLVMAAHGMGSFDVFKPKKKATSHLLPSKAHVSKCSDRSAACSKLQKHISPTFTIKSQEPCHWITEPLQWHVKKYRKPQFFSPWFLQPMLKNGYKYKVISKKHHINQNSPKLFRIFVTTPILPGWRTSASDSPAPCCPPAACARPPPPAPPAAARWALRCARRRGGHGRSWTSAGCLVLGANGFRWWFDQSISLCGRYACFCTT